MTDELRQQVWDSMPEEVKKYAELQYFYTMHHPQIKLLMELLGIKM